MMHVRMWVELVDKFDYEAARNDRLFPRGPCMFVFLLLLRSVEFV